MSMVESLDEIYRWVWLNLLMRSTDEYGWISWWDLQMSMVESLDEIYRWVWWNLLMRSTYEYGGISWFLNRVQRTTDPVLLVYIRYSDRSIYWVSPLREDGAPTCPSSHVSWISYRSWLLCIWVSLLHEPSRESRASSGCFISWVSRLREDGASACPGDFGCSVLECTFYMNHLKNLEFHLAAPYLGCLHREKMELLHVLEILAPLCFECSYYMNHLENLELHLVHPDP